jgi:hypothetical protein
MACGWDKHVNDHHAVQVASAQPLKLHTQHIITADITTQQPTASVGEYDLTVISNHTDKYNTILQKLQCDDGQTLIRRNAAIYQLT